MSTDYDVIVVGAGIFGSCTAYNCQKLGLKTLLLEQFELGHVNGSSHGKSRITRYAHTEVEYVPLVSDAYEQIFELERIRGEKLWKKTGLLWVSTGNEVEKIHNNLKSKNIEHEVVKGTEIESRYPQFKFNDEWNGLIDPMGGVIYANKWLHAFQDQFKKIGGIIHDHEAVLSHSENGEILSVVTPKSRYTTKKIIFTVGCWITKFLPHVNFNIEPISISVCYWKAKNQADSFLLNEDHYPVVIAQEMDLKVFHYSLPDTDYPGAIKFCYHYGDPLTKDNKHPEQRSQRCIDLPADFIKKYMPVVDGSAPTKVDKCIYTNSPDDHYIIGRVPGKNANILVGGCGSGSGFKVAPGIGKALAEMAAGRKTTVDVSFFSADRFKPSKI
uniref:sarcosine oxidasee (formaldehyde-forming) n=1 Tax=Caenorhabditis japonica TaxID=281687 RepID=A0A8R1DVC7_CAEJA